MIPTYNQADMLARAIQSALDQDYENIEIIISDDCSTDDTQLVVKKYLYDEKIKYYRHDKNIGRVANYRYTLKYLATGDWVVNLDGDDFYIDNSFISYAISRIKFYKNKHIVIVQTARENREFNKINSLGTVITPDIDGNEKVIIGEEFFKITHRKFFSHMTTLYDRQEAIKMDFYRYNILSSDMESILRLALKGDVLLSKRVCGVWTRHEKNLSLNGNIVDLEKNTLYIEGAYCEAKNMDITDVNKWKKEKFVDYMLFVIISGFKYKKGWLYFKYVITNYAFVFFSLYFHVQLIKKITQKLQ